MKKTRRVCALVLGITMLFGNVGYAEEECAAEQEAVEIELEASERAASDIAFLEEAFPMREDCSKREERKVERLVERAANDAVLTAEQLNEITDEKIYDVALHEVLDKYYGENLEERWHSLRRRSMSGHGRRYRTMRKQRRSGRTRRTWIMRPRKSCSPLKAE